MLITFPLHTIKTSVVTPGETSTLPLFVLQLRVGRTIRRPFDKRQSKNKLSVKLKIYGGREFSR